MPITIGEHYTRKHGLPAVEGIRVVNYIAREVIRTLNKRPKILQAKLRAVLLSEATLQHPCVMALLPRKHGETDCQLVGAWHKFEIEESDLPIASDIREIMRDCCREPSPPSVGKRSLPKKVQPKPKRNGGR
jgi:hypothetical protein